MAYIKIYDSNLAPIGVLEKPHFNTKSLNLKGWWKVYNENMALCGAIDSEHLSESTNVDLLIKLYDEELNFVGVITLANLLGAESNEGDGGGAALRGEKE